MKQPIKTFQELLYTDDIDKPIPFGINLFGKLGLLQSQLDWRLEDFIRIQRIIYYEIHKDNKEIDKIEVEPFTNDINDEENIGIARLYSYILGRERQNRITQSFVDQMTIVGLWAITEQFLGRIFRQYFVLKDLVNEADIKTPYKWDDFKKEFRKIGIELSTCENYNKTNECRVLNNCIKHHPFVSNDLIRFSFFSTYGGKDLENVELEMQKYYNAVSDFLGSLIEKTNEKLE